jgi:hypothetical protein
MKPAGDFGRPFLDTGRSLYRPSIGTNGRWVAPV